MPIILVYNLKGGSGKTTTAVNLAVSLAKKKFRVLLLDLDPQGHATAHLGITANKTTCDLIITKTPLVEVVHSVSSHLHLVPSSLDLAVAEMDLFNKISREHVLKKKLKGHNYDIVVIDSPPSLGLLTINAMNASTYLLIPVQAEFFAVESISKFLGSVEHVQEELNPELTILGFVITQYDTRVKICKDVKSNMDEAFPNMVFKSIIRRNSRLAECPSAGQSIFEYARKSNGAKDYQALTKEILGVMEVKKRGRKTRVAK